MQRLRDHVRQLLPVVRQAMRRFRRFKGPETAVLKKMVCGDASTMMEILLRRNGFEVERASIGTDHAFVVVNHDIIVDAAHLQFDRNLPATDRGDILVLPYKDLEARLQIWANGDKAKLKGYRRLWDSRAKRMKLGSGLHLEVKRQANAAKQPVRLQVDRLLERMWAELRWARVHGPG